MRTADELEAVELELELELEPLAPVGLEDFDPRPRHQPREPLRLTPMWLAGVAVVMAGMGVLAAYRANAINAVRALEQDRRAAELIKKDREALGNRLLAHVVTEADVLTAANAHRALMEEHRRRLFDLADHANAVNAVDAGARRLREALVGALLRDAHDLDHAARAPVPDTVPKLGGDFAAVDKLLDSALRRWSLTPVDPKRPPARLAAADDALARLSRWSDEPLGASMVVLRGSDLSLLDVDAGINRPLAKAFPDLFAVADTFIAVHTDGGVETVDLAPPHDRRLIAPDNGMFVFLVRAAEPDTVWVQENPNGTGKVSRYDRAGNVVESIPAQGVLRGAVGDRLLWAHRREAGPDEHTLTDRSGRVLGRWTGREPISTSPGGVAWRLNGMELLITDAEGRPVPYPGQTRPFLRDATWSRDGRRLAVSWNDNTLDVLDMATGTVTATLRVRRGASDMVWTADGERLFLLTGTGFGYYRVGDAAVTPLRVRRSEGAPLAVVPSP